MKWRKPSYVGRGLVALAILLGWRLAFCGRLPSDTALVRKFHEHRPAFVELRSMLATNNSADAAGDEESVWPQAQFERYLALLRQTGVNRVMVEADEIRFQILGPASPTATNRYRIAVAWTAANPEPLVANLKDFRKMAGRPDHAYRSLGDGWYLWIAR